MWLKIRKAADAAWPRSPIRWIFRHEHTAEGGTTATGDARATEGGGSAVEKMNVRAVLSRSAAMSASQATKIVERDANVVELLGPAPGLIEQQRPGGREPQSAR